MTPEHISSYVGFTQLNALVVDPGMLEKRFDTSQFNYMKISGLLQRQFAKYQRKCSTHFHSAGEDPG